MTTPENMLPPGRLRRGRYLLTGRIRAADAHPLELAYAVRHILTHPNLDADAWHRSREEVALAELRASLGDHPRSHFGTAALLAVVATAGSQECVRCRANMIARTRGLALPYRDTATDYLLGGPGCARCRPGPAASGPASRAGGTARPRPTLAQLRAWVDRATLGVVRDPDGAPPLPRISDRPIHPALRR